MARACFSADHGVVSLILDQKLVLMPEGTLRRELRLVAKAMERGLDARAGTLPHVAPAVGSSGDAGL